MANTIIHRIENVLSERVVEQKTVGGGCIAQSSLIKTSSNYSYFLKQGFKGDIFLKEANGLKELQKSTTIRIPKVIIADNDYLLLEAIENGIAKNDFFTQFGAAFASLHKHSNDLYGFYEDNYIGSTPQQNKQDSSWENFYFTQRLLPQFKLLKKNGYADKELISLFNTIENQLPSILSGSAEKPSLLHGDLWSGNFMIDVHGNPVLIDPAVYYGHREADLAMTKLFGGFSPDFYTSYNAEFPLAGGYEYRENIYLLYHVLNHLNLFGRSYKSHAIALMKSYQ